jgi:Na+/melibiose symporter-like transporter
MDLLIILGAVISVIGIAGIILSIVQVRRAKRDTTDDAELKAKIQSAMPLNLGSFLLSVLGLMCVMMGVILA